MADSMVQQQELPPTFLASDAIREEDSVGVSVVLSTPVTEQENLASTPNNKVRCPSNEIGINCEVVAMVSDVGMNREMFDSGKLNVRNVGSIPSGRIDDNHGQETREVGDFDRNGVKEGLGFSNREVGLSGIQKIVEVNEELFIEIDKNSKQEKAVLESVIPLSAESECIENLARDDNEDVLIRTETESESLLEAKKKQLLAELEDGKICEGKAELCKVVQNISKMMDVPVSLPLKDEVIDDTALIETFPVLEAGNGSLMDSELLSSAKATERNKAKRPRRKGKGKDVKMVMDAYYGVQKNGDQSNKMYSRKELESLRFAKIVDQRKLWKDICTGLGPTVLSEYSDLASSKNQKNNRLNSDPRECIARKNQVPAMLGGNCSETVNKESEYKEDYTKETANCLETMTKDADTVLEEELLEDSESDEEYGSILKPAFMVEGEPDFQSGPPEDGLEYLRWEAAQIPKVKVAKVDKSKYKKEQSVYMPNIPEIAVCPQHLLPLKQWEDEFLADFSELRRVLSLLSGETQAISIADPENRSCQLPENIIAVKLDNLHIDESELCVNAPHNEISGSDQNPVPRTSAVDNYSPTLSAIRRMDSVARVSMLRKRISSVEALSAISRNEGEWLFGLCVAVDTPLEADTCASMRSLLRKCASLRAGKSEVDDEVIMLNILVTISGRYFGQLQT